MLLSIVRPQLGLFPIPVRGMGQDSDVPASGSGCAQQIEAQGSMQLEPEQEEGPTEEMRVPPPILPAEEQPPQELSGRFKRFPGLSQVKLASPARPRKRISSLSGDVESLRQNGAVVNVLVSMPSAHVSAAEQQGQSIPEGKVVKALVDTGASISTIDDATAAEVGLVQTGSLPLGGVGGSSERPVYAARIEIKGTEFSFDPIEMAGVIMRVWGSTSQRTSLAPADFTALAAVTKQMSGTTTSSPFLRPRLWTTVKSASEQELVETTFAASALMCAAKAASNAFVAGPLPIHEDSITFRTASSSAAPKDGCESWIICFPSAFPASVPGSIPPCP